LNKSILIVAPHADDETLGCGGTILRYLKEGYLVHWLLVTSMSKDAGFSDEQINARASEIKQVYEAYGFESIHLLGYPPAQLDLIGKGELVDKISDVVNKIQPFEVFTVYRNDSHSDHQAVFDAVLSATKSFRYPFIKRVLAYETMSETDFGLKPEDRGFRPNIFIGIEKFLEKKLDIMDIYKSEVQDFPFPRSRIGLTALANLRGTQCNEKAAEAFMLLKEIR
jgi:N-acetylglucosamine malate deacetylase 1